MRDVEAIRDRERDVEARFLVAAASATAARGGEDDQADGHAREKDVCRTGAEPSKRTRRTPAPDRARRPRHRSVSSARSHARRGGSPSDEVCGPLNLTAFLPMMRCSEASPQTAADARACRRDRCCLERDGRPGRRPDLLRRRRRGRAPLGQLAADGDRRQDTRPALDPDHAPVEARADAGSGRLPERC